MKKIVLNTAVLRALLPRSLGRAAAAGMGTFHAAADPTERCSDGQRFRHDVQLPSPLNEEKPCRTQASL